MIIGFRCTAFTALLLLFCSPKTFSQSIYGTTNKNYEHSVALSRAFRQWEVYQLDAPALWSAVKNQGTPDITLGTHTWHLNLESSGILSTDYTLQVITPEGKEVRHTQPDIAFKGYETQQGGQVRLTLTDNFIYGFVEETGDTYYIEPLWYHEPSAAPDLFVVYADKAVIPNQNATCLAKERRDKYNNHPIHTEPQQDAPETITACFDLELAIASDRSMFNKYGTITNVQNHNIGVINAVEVNYTGVFTHDIQFSIITQLVITGTDPWTNSTDPGNLLDDFTDWGDDGGFGVAHDLGELWTNRNFDESTVGIAWVDAVCTDVRYHCLQDFTSSAQQLRCMTSHEIGHNFGCNHDPETGSSCPPNFIMCPFVSTSNTWSTTSRNTVNGGLPFLISIGCLEPCGGSVPLVADLDWSPNPACQSQTVHFTDQSTGSVTGRSWTFQGGTPATSTQQNPNVVWATAGTFNVTLTVTGPGGPSSVTQQVTISPKPTANFTYTVSGNTVTFINTSVNADTYFWNLGNNFTSTEENPQFTYPNSGTYGVTLTATNSCGTSTKTLPVKTAPTAAFTGSPQSGCTPLTVQFINQSTGTLITSYNWQFPGGTPATSTSPSPAVVYNTAGVFDVTLTVANSSGSSTLVKEGLISTISQPTAGFTWQINNLSVQFTNTSTGGTTYSWDFGDGTTSNEISPNHVYSTGDLYTVTLTVSNTCGTKTFTRTIQLEQGPTPGFTANVTGGCGPLTVSFSNTSSENADTFAWAFPGGTPASSTEANPTVVYNQPGSYTVTLTTGNEAGTATLTQQNFITVNSGPTAAFSSSATQLVASFSNTSVNATSYLWNFGDGSTPSTVTNPSHTYATDGVYTVTLTATNSCGSVIVTHTVTVVSIPVAAFAATPAAGCAPHTVQFSNQSSSNAVSFLWTFPGGSPASSTSANPTVMYTVPGDYSATLIATNAAGTDTMLQTSVVTINSGPTAAFTAGTNGAVATFDNTSGNATSYSWNFGDGSTTSTAPEPSHTYTTDGIYTVILTATNGCGSNTSTRTVTIVTPPTTSFTLSQTSGCAPLTVQFTNQSSANATSFQWEFPGGTPATSTLANPVVVYSAPGFYTATLVAGNAAGNGATVQNAIILNSGPTAGFSSSSNNATVSFTNTSVNATSYLWNFGDASPISFQQNPNHTYAADGTYTVTLTATNGCGSNITTHTVTVVTPPAAGFATAQTTGCGPFVVQFSNQSSSNATTFQWQFPGGNPTTSTQANPVVTYTAPGSYTAFLTASNAAGSSTVSQADYITVIALPTVHFEPTIDGANATFSNTSQNGQSFFWNFGDTGSASNTSTESHPSHHYEQDGTYTVTLTVMNNCGAASSSQIITIVTPPSAQFDITGDHGCAPATIQFQNTSSENAVSYAWEFEGGEPATSVEKDPIVVWTEPGYHAVRLTTTNAAGSTFRNDTITVEDLPAGAFTFQTAGLSVVTENTSAGAVSYHWNFGDPASGPSNESTEPAPVHTFPSTGAYSVRLIAENTCGADTAFSLVVIAGDAPIADFSAGNVSVICAPATVQFNDLSAGGPNSWLWEFPGGEPAVSSEQNPVVTYSQPGIYIVSLTSTNIYGSNTVTDDQGVVIVPAPVATFETVTNNDVVSFSNGSTGADTYLWQFGDGDTSSLASPEHTYTASGVYNIVLVASNDCGTDIFAQSVTLLLTSAPDLAAWNLFRIFPNPNNGRFTLEMSGTPQDKVEFVVFNTLGQQLVLETASFRSGYLQQTFDYSDLPAAMYNLRVRAGGQSRFVKIAVQR